MLSFFTLILLGVSQQLAIWYCVVGGALSARKTPGAALGTTATFLSCALGFLLGLPLTTEVSRKLSRSKKFLFHAKNMHEI